MYMDLSGTIKTGEQTKIKTTNVIYLPDIPIVRKANNRVFHLTFLAMCSNENL